MIHHIRTSHTVWLILLVVLLMGSCGSIDNNSKNQVADYVSFDERFVQNNVISDKANTLFIKIISEKDWTLSWDQPDWVEIDQATSGKGTTAIPVFIHENRKPSERRVVFTVKFGGQKKTITLIQSKSGAQPVVANERLEIPKLRNDANSQFVAHYVDHDGKRLMNYCLEFAKDKHLSRWVAFRFDDITAQKNTKRSNAWGSDPVLGSLCLEAYSGIYHRGHMVASEDRVFSIEANKQTFYYSNISPQLQPFNEGAWLKLEDVVRGWGRNSSLRDTLYVVKGTSIDNPKYISEYINRGRYKVPIASYWYMAVLKVKNGKYSAIAFWSRHDRNNNRKKINSDDIISVRDLEKLVDVDFFHLLPQSIEDQVETTIDVKEWPGI